MKTGLFAALLCVVALVASSLSKEASWTGNDTDKKYLGGQAVFQLKPAR